MKSDKKKGKSKKTVDGASSAVVEKGPSFATQVAEAITAVEKIRTILPTLVSLTAEERTKSEGRFRDGELVVLGSILDVVEANASYFASLADEDEGHDPNRLETELLRDRLDHVKQLATLRGALESATTEVADTMLATGALVRPVLLSAYRLAKPNKKLRTKLTKAIDFYAAPAAKASKTKKAKQKST
jgi:hypothetical protein